MAKDLDIREDREIEHLRGVGGFIEFKWPTETPIQTYQRLEIKQWEIWHAFVNARMAESGGHGSLTRYRVADDFTFAVLIDIDLTPTRSIGPAPGSRSQPYYDGRMEGLQADDFHIAIRFQCGDPTFYTHPEMQSIARPAHKYPPGSEFTSGLQYRCKEVLLDKVYIINSARGTDVPGAVVTCRVDGSGSAPLERWVDDIWCGAGALGISQALQEA